MNRKIQIVMLCAVSALFLNRLSAQDFKEIHKSFTINKSGEVTIDTYKGRITVEPSNSDVVDVYVKIEPDGSGFFSTSEKKQLADANVVIEASANSVKLKTEYKHNDDSWFGSNTRALVNYTIKMPKTAALNVKDYKSDSDVKGLESAIEFETYKGTVKIHELAGSIRFKSYKGEAEFRLKKLTGDSRFETYKGDITVYLPKSTGFSFNSDFGKRVDFDNGFNLPKKNKSNDYSGNVNGGGPEIRITSDKGNINLRAD